MSFTSNSQHQKCRLCDANAPLIESHIFSKFLFKEILVGDPQYLRVLSLSNAKKEQGGLKEYLLCRKCEGKRSKWEGYARHFLFSNNAPQMIHVERELYRIENINYKKLKLFILSTLWLLSISETNKGEIDLGPHENNIKQMVLNEDPGDSQKYSILLKKYDFEHATELLVYDRRVQKGIYNVYYMFLGGFLWTVFVDSRPLKGVLRDAVLQENGTAYLIKVTTNEYDFFKEFGGLITGEV